MPELKAKSNHYVDNQTFLAQMTEYRQRVIESKEKGVEKPRVPNYIGLCLFKIATHLARKPNFANYSFKEDMISDGVENCLMYIDNFNPERSTNPFAYFTQIIYYAFLRRIQKEKKQMYVKYKSMENEIVTTLTDSNADDIITQNINGMIHDAYAEEFIRDFIEAFETNERKKSSGKKKKVGLIKFMEDDDATPIPAES